MTEEKNNMEEEISQEEIFNAKESGTHITKCPSCGANLTYDPETRGMKCDYCGTKVDLDLNKYAQELDFTNLMTAMKNDWSGDVHVFRCNNCGAKAVIRKDEISKKCAFCGTSNVVETGDLCGLKPNAVLPFFITKQNACERVVAWAKKKVLAPKKFKESVYPDEIHGNYSPAFTFDTNTRSTYDGRLGEYYYVTVSKIVDGKRVTVQERRTRWFSIRGNYDKSFDDVLIQAAATMEQKVINKLAPFDTNRSQQYTQEFLQGFSATQYAKDGKACWEEAKGVIVSALEKAILAQYKYDVVGYINVNTSYYDITYKYILLPVWVGHCNYAKKLYNFFVNGQNGKVAGKTPVSAIKVGLIVLAGIAVIVAIGLLYYFYGG